MKGYFIRKERYSNDCVYIYFQSEAKNNNMEMGLKRGSTNDRNNCLRIKEPCSFKSRQYLFLSTLQYE